ncbi:MAG: hypothetical protein QE271_00460 [Bacteriovoracaceae bacterium]|nr:hypothetical protein [Bacteriovoracaceae bacterium]
MEVEQVFLNRIGPLAKEVRVNNQGMEIRFWFISKTNKGRRLKIVFFIDPEEKAPVVITAYEPNDDEVSLYEKIKRKKKK